MNSKKRGRINVTFATETYIIMTEELYIMNWSGGKDSTLALHRAKHQKLNITQLRTTTNKLRQRVTMHGVKQQLVEAQAQALGLPIEFIGLSEMASIETYNATMEKLFLKDFNNQVKKHIYGDIFLEDLKKYRDHELGKRGLVGHYPLWKQNSLMLANEFISLGYKAIVVAASADKLGASFVGREFNESFLNDLPTNVDPSGENGEFHTFVYDGPMFSRPIPVKAGKIELHSYPSTESSDCELAKNDCFTEGTWETGFWFCELDSQ